MNATKNIRRFQLCVILSMTMSYGVPAASQGGETCPPNSSGPDICVSFDGDTPQEEVHFRVDYTTDAANPSVELLTGNLTWNVRSDDSGSAGNIGTISLDPTVSSDDFEVTIANGAGAGAANVGLINLNVSGFTGYSSIEGNSLISGNLGGLTLVKDGSGNGGVLNTLRALGDVTGPVSIPTVKGWVNQLGKLIGAADLTIGEIDGTDAPAQLQIGGIECASGVCPDITVTGRIFDGLLLVSGAVPSATTIKIEELDASGSGLAEVDVSDNADFAGTLDLPNGLANANTLIDMGGTLTGVIDLHSGAVVGEIAVYIGSSTAEIKNGGAVSGDVYLSQNTVGQDNKYEGTATFASVSSTGEIATTSTVESLDADFGGTLTVTGDVEGLIEIVGSLLSGAEINLTGWLTGGLVSGEIVIEDDCVGDIDVTESVSGDICIGGDLTGNVTVGDALANSGLAGGGQILVAGKSTGAIKVGKKTASMTLIQVAAGLGTGATIEINTTEGKFDAEGDIHIGGSTPTALPFDGCIRIYDDRVSSDNRDLTGEIDVVACHADGDELIICIDGSDNGNVTLNQLGCSPANAEWDCFSPGCP